MVQCPGMWHFIILLILCSVTCYIRLMNSCRRRSNEGNIRLFLNMLSLYETSRWNTISDFFAQVINVK